MALDQNTATSELFTNYKAWCKGTVNASNAPQGCSQITIKTAQHMRNLWNNKSQPNSWNQSASTGQRIEKTGDTRWVTRSLSGGSDVVDFHSLWGSVRFLRHFQIVP